MLTARQGRLLVLALVVHFALLLPVADLAHGSAHHGDDTCDTCVQFGALQGGLTPATAAEPPPAVAPGPAGPRVVTPVVRAATRATARAPPAG
jgi:hypothetical protein